MISIFLLFFWNRPEVRFETCSLNPIDHEEMQYGFNSTYFFARPRSHDKIERDYWLSIYWKKGKKSICQDKSSTKNTTISSSRSWIQDEGRKKHWIVYSLSCGAIVAVINTMIDINLVNSEIFNHSTSRIILLSNIISLYSIEMNICRCDFYSLFLYCVDGIMFLLCCLNVSSLIVPRINLHWHDERKKNGYRGENQEREDEERNELGLCTHSSSSRLTLVHICLTWIRVIFSSSLIRVMNQGEVISHLMIIRVVDNRRSVYRPGYRGII